MKPTGRMLRCLSALALPLALVVSACGGAKAGGAGGAFGSGYQTVSASPEILSQEQAMFERLNSDRAGKGLPPLAYDGALADIGRAHSKDMVDNKFFAHDSPNTGSLDDRIVRAGYLAAVARENLAEAPDVSQAQDGLLNSPGHYANIMADDITHVGIGIVPGGEGGAQSLTFTQVFAKPIEPIDVSDAKASVKTQITSARAQAGIAPLPEHPLLMSLAEEYVQELAAGFKEGAVDTVGEKISQRLSEDRSHGLGGAAVLAERLLTVHDYDVSPVLLDGGVRAFGFAAAETTDERGRPAAVFLFLAGR